MPHIKRDTYNCHGLGPVIFTMEGFEYKNYTSKQVMRSRTNGRGIQCMQSLRVMQLLFTHAFFSVKDELTSVTKRNEFVR